MSPADVIATDAICPQCRTGMVHVAVTPHPVVRNMQRKTFACYSCKRTRLPESLTPSDCPLPNRLFSRRFRNLYRRRPPLRRHRR